MSDRGSTATVYILYPILLVILLVLYFVLSPSSTGSGEAGEVPGFLASRVRWGAPEVLEDCKVYNTGSLNVLKQTADPSTLENTAEECVVPGRTIRARKVVYTCAVNVPPNIQPYPCIRMDGTEAMPGQTEEFWEECTADKCEAYAKKIGFRRGTLPTDPISCLKENVGNFLLVDCDVGDPTIFRVARREDEYSEPEPIAASSPISYPFSGKYVRITMENGEEMRTRDDDYRANVSVRSVPPDGKKSFLWELHSPGTPGEVTHIFPNVGAAGRRTYTQYAIETENQPVSVAWLGYQSATAGDISLNVEFLDP